MLKKVPFLIICCAAMISGCERPSSADETFNQTIDPSACDPDDDGLELPDDFCATVVVDTLGRLRHIVVSETGDVYVIHRQPAPGGGITALRDTTGDGKADVVQTFGEISGTGIDLVDGYLYVSDNTAVYRYPMIPGELVPQSPPETIVSGFPVQQPHAAKAFAFDESGNLYVNVGAPSNNCQDPDRTPGALGQDPCLQRERQAGVWRFDAERAGQTQQADGHRFVTGTRNIVAIAWNPVAKNLYAVQHGRDQLNNLWPDLFTVEESAEIPAEEFILLEDGADFGWPYCFFDPIQGKKVLAPEYGGDGEEIGLCADKVDPTYAFPGHYAPNDLVFYTASQFPSRYRNGAFIAFHGSWNRAPGPQGGYLVAFLPFDADGPAGDWETFADGFKGAEPLLNPSDAVYRPVGLAVGSDGSLYITDSQKGRIWKVVYTGEE